MSCSTSRVHGDGLYAELAADGGESVGGASGDGDFAALGNKFRGEGAAHSGAAADDDYMF